MSYSCRPRFPTLSTGVVSIDLALGTGGLPGGEIVEICGSPSAGKTTLALHITAEAQMLGLTGLYLDLEGGLTGPYAQRCGVSPEETLIGSPIWGEDALDLAHLALSSRGIQLVVLDTIAALRPRAGQYQPAGRPAGSELNDLLVPGIRRLRKICQKTGGWLICLNQLRTRLRSGYGLPETSPGGLVLKMQAAVRIRLDRYPDPHRGTSTRDQRVQVTILKNTGAEQLRNGIHRNGYRSAFFDIVYNKGIPREKELISLAIKENIVQRVGSQYVFRERALGEKPSEITALLRAHRTLRQTLRSDLYQQLLP